MERIMHLISIVFMVSGLLCYALAYRHRSPMHPGLNPVNTIKPKNWIPFWKAKDWYDPIGYRLQSISAVLLALGALIALLAS